MSKPFKQRTSGDLYRGISVNKQPEEGELYVTFRSLFIQPLTYVLYVLLVNERFFIAHGISIYRRVELSEIHLG